MTAKKTTKAIGRAALKASYTTAVVTGGVAIKGLRLGIRRSQRFPDLPDLPQGDYVDLPGRGAVYVVDTGAPHKDAPTLLLFHGLATTAYLNWFSTINELRKDHRVVMFDQRWHGRGIMSDRFDLADCVDDAAAILDHLDIDQVIAVGYSMGGALAQV
ncbi:MAG: alpha/beta fold hydrolase, partial [Aeromicrobium sp.]